MGMLGIGRDRFQAPQGRKGCDAKALAAEFLQRLLDISPVKRLACGSLDAFNGRCRSAKPCGAGGPKQGAVSRWADRKLIDKYAVSWRERLQGRPHLLHGRDRRHRRGRVL
jgi:hypothetical protein